MKLSPPAIPDVEDSALENSGYDSHCLMVPDQISEAEWVAGPSMNWIQEDFEESVQLCEAFALEKDIAVNEVNVLQANFDNLVLENEQLKSEINELKEKLKGKTEIDEFEALEKQTQKDHEIELMHGITSLKNLISNAEVYSEELEAEINSKLEQLKEKENKIKMLQNRVEELQKAEVEKKETSFALGDCDKLTEEVQQLNKSLLDSEAIALDAKKESAFLRSENLELKEKMNIVAHEDLRNTQNSLKESQKTVKKLGKSISEKESRILSVQEALGKTFKELQIWISEMREEMKIITAERDQLAEEKLGSNNCRESDQLQVQKEQINFLTQENRSLQEKLDSLLLKREESGEGTLSLTKQLPQIQGQSMEQELFLLREERSQALQKLHEMEEAKASEYQGESEKMERTDVIPKPYDCQEVSAQTEGDGDDFKMQLENLQKERDQLRETLQEMISKNSEMQEELRCTCEALGQHQEQIVELTGRIAEKENQLLRAQEELKEKTDELQQKVRSSFVKIAISAGFGSR